MTRHPAAFVPSAIAKSELTSLARSLRLIEGNEKVETAPNNGARMVSFENSFQDFPASYSSGVAKLPAMYVDFSSWLYVPARDVSGGPPATATSDRRLRMIIRATYNLDDRWGGGPVNNTVAFGGFEWIDSSAGTPSAEPGVTAGAEFDYYFYLLRVQAGVIVARAASPLFVGWPLLSA